MLDGRGSALRRLLATSAMGALSLAAACGNSNNGSTSGTGGVAGTTTSATATTGKATAGNSTGTGTGTGTTSASGTATASGTGTTGTSLGAKVVANAGFTSPFDAVLSSDGSKVYFTALSSGSATIFSALANGSAAAIPTNLAVSGLSAPFGLAVSTDGTTLYVADLGFEDPSTNALGEISSVAVAGGAATPLSGTPGYAPVGLTVASVSGADTIYFTGTDPANAMPGLFKVVAAGGSATVVAEGAPFLSPSGVAVDSAGNAYVVDQGMVIKVSASVATVLADSLNLGFPGGIAVAAGGTQLLVSGTDPSTGNDALVTVTISSTTAPTYTFSAAGQPFAGFSDPGGLHGNGTQSTFVDGTASGTGAVYVIQ